jgi:hypothetical protein
MLESGVKKINKEFIIIIIIINEMKNIKYDSQNSYPLTYKYMTATFPWFRHFNNRWWD